ncbi:hypothetical protein PVAND_003199 [Polypedilum vanderplanki]|uniref:Large ribosomal subunit protein mL46 n=1 Tax=Polypedilum vanderplanki TaxID=319348 RepID=A0A9J6BU91_POLVA|nr:hypothetical protein PVAND_003199 [Polypedilum vanderplanki]
MLRKILLNSSKTFAYATRSYSTAAQLKTKEKYDLYAGVLIERLPIITKKLNELETEVLEMLKKIEFENSLKSDHELRKEKDIRQAELIKSGKLDKDSETEAVSLQTAQDFEDASNEELAKFLTAPRITEDDKKNNLKSLNRKLDDALMLLVDEKIGNDSRLLLPQGKWLEGETLRQTAERIVREKFGTDLKVQFYGSAPVGFYKFKYTSSQNESVGGKVFFFRAIYKSGNIPDSKLKYEWLSGEELKGKVRDSYYKSVESFCTF